MDEGHKMGKLSLNNILKTNKVSRYYQCSYAALPKCNSPAKYRIQLFRDVVFLVADSLGAKLQYNIRICFAIEVHWVQVICFYYIYTNQNMNGIIGWESLEKPILWIKSHNCVVLNVFREWPFVNFDRTLHMRQNNTLIGELHKCHISMNYTSEYIPEWLRQNKNQSFIYWLEDSVYMICHGFQTLSTNC